MTTRMETIKQKYDACELTYEAALAQLEALGMWASDADDYLAQKIEDTVPSSNYMSSPYSYDRD